MTSSYTPPAAFVFVYHLSPARSHLAFPGEVIISLFAHPSEVTGMANQSDAIDDAGVASGAPEALGPNTSLDRATLKPSKKIHSGEDLVLFLNSKAYYDLKAWLLILTSACFPRKTGDPDLEVHELDAPFHRSHLVIALSDVLREIELLIDEAPPDTGPRRFGNVAFRKWFQLLENSARVLLKQRLTPHLQARLEHGSTIDHDILDELEAYLLASFGSPQRLDYGTGHELSFLAFLGCFWKLGAINEGEEWAIVAGIVQPYVALVRKLIKTYTLEPAGSHGVWGLDDHSFIPYIFGSAQLSPPLAKPSQPRSLPQLPTEGSLSSAPDPASVTSLPTVNEWKKRNFYYAAIAFILDVKKGPFFEHSPYLYNISGIKDGWGKINKGMLKMYDAEVLGKFPVIQHFPFGRTWRWEKDPNATPMGAANVHVSNQPSAESRPASGTQAPWATTRTAAAGGTQSQVSTRLPPTRAPWSGASNLPGPTRHLPPGSNGPRSGRS